MADEEAAVPATPEMRIADADRDATVARLSRAMSEGRLEVTEFEERSRAAYAAKVMSDLVPLTADLPVPAEQPAPPASVVSSVDASSSGGRRRWMVSLFGDRRHHRWNPGDRALVFSLFGDQTLEFPADGGADVDVVSISIFGDLRVEVAPATSVAFDGFSVFGDVRDEVSLPPAGTRADVRVRRFALFGDARLVER